MKFTPVALSIAATLFLSSCLDDLRNSFADDTSTNTSTVTDTDTQICVDLESQVYFTTEIIENNVVTFDASSSYIAQCSGAAEFETYFWDFGDGTQIQTNSAITTHHFDDSETSYLVTLSHESGNSYSSIIQPKINDDICDVTSYADFTYQIDNNTISVDASSSSLFEGCDFVDITNYNWMFNGVEINSTSAQASYTSNGSENVYITLTVSNDTQELSTSKSVQLQSALECAQSASIEYKTFEKLATFSAQLAQGCENTSLGYSWELGDGNFVDGQIVEHEYAHAGLYPVTLTVEANEGIATHHEEIVILVEYLCPAPISQFTYSINENVVTFTSLSIDPCDHALSHSWDFGDGSNLSSVSNSITYAYLNSGAYNVSLTSTSPEGQSSTSTQTVIVGEPNYEIQVDSLFPGSDDVRFSIDIPQYERNELNYDWYSTGFYQSVDEIYNVMFSDVGTYIVVGSVYGPDGFYLRLEMEYEVTITYCGYAPIAPPQPPYLETSVTDLNVELSIHSFNSGCHDSYTSIDFGDGSEIVEIDEANDVETINHTYDQAGTYLIQVVTQTGVEVIEVVVTEPLVCEQNHTAYFTVEMLSDYDFRFEASYGPGCINHFHWDFGDGTTLQTNDSVVEHRFEELGEYNVMLSRGGEQHYVAKIQATTAYPSEYISLDFNYSGGESAIDMYALARINELTLSKPIYIIDPVIDEPSVMPVVEEPSVMPLVDVEGIIDVLPAPPLNNFEFAYTFNMGDGTIYLPNTYSPYGYPISHEYIAGGIYPITISASNYFGQNISVDIDMHITHVDKILSDFTVDISGSQVFVIADTSFNFDQAIALPIHYTWDFGDGTIYTGLELNYQEHVYAEIGNYDVTVTMVTQDESLSSVKTFGVVISTLD